MNTELMEALNILEKEKEKDGGKEPWFVVQKFVYTKSEKIEDKGFRGTQNDCQSIFFLDKWKVFVHIKKETAHSREKQGGDGLNAHQKTKDRDL